MEKGEGTLDFWKGVYGITNRLIVQIETISICIVMSYVAYQGDFIHLYSPKAFKISINIFCRHGYDDTENINHFPFDNDKKTCAQYPGQHGSNSVDQLETGRINHDFRAHVTWVRMRRCEILRCCLHLALTSACTSLNKYFLREFFGTMSFGLRYWNS
jgi:hypothetical protein